MDDCVRDSGSRRRRLEGLRVLIVDDAADVRGLVVMILKLQGASVTAVDSAAAALRAVAESVPDVLVSDIGMPDQDGYDLIRSLRASENPQARRIPAAALTAFAKVEDRKQALEAGFQVHLAKPIEASLLVDAVVELAGRTLLI